MKAYKIMVTTLFSIASDDNVASDERHINNPHPTKQFNIFKWAIHNELIILIDFMESATAEFP